jgi:16S rRNA U516 pseudouridylate synthase RsuA-like enzyme
MAEALGLKVEWLHRVAYGPVRLGRLAEARYRALTPAEIRAIDRLGADNGQVTGRRAPMER